MEKLDSKNPKKELNIYEKRFEKLMMLIRIDRKLKSATITHKKIEKQSMDILDECYKVSSLSIIYNLPIHFLHINHLTEAKKQSGRPKDLIDIIELERIRNQRE